MKLQWIGGPTFLLELGSFRVLADPVFGTGDAAFYLRPQPLSEKARKLLSPEAAVRLTGLASVLRALGDWTESGLEQAVRDFAEGEAVKLGQIAQPLRAALTGSTASPGIFEVMRVLGQEECVARIEGRISGGQPVD